MGYIDRSLNNPSQRRSGLAAAALRRLSGGNMPSRNALPMANMPGGMSGVGSMTRAPMTPQAPMGAASGAPTGENVGMSSSPAMGMGNPYSPLGVNNMGRLRVNRPAGQPERLEDYLPSDPIASDDYEEMLAQKNAFEQQLLEQQNELERDYTLNRRETELGLAADQRDVLEGFAGRGLAYSSGYTYDRGQVDNAYANVLNSLDQDRTRGKAGFDKSRGEFETGYNRQLQMIAEAAARRAAQRAGELGLGAGERGTIDRRIRKIGPIDRPAPPGPFKRPGRNTGSGREGMNEPALPFSDKPIVFKPGRKWY